MHRDNIPHDSSDPKEIQTEAIPLMDWLYNFSFYLTGSKSSAKKIIKRTYNKVLEYFDKTRGGADYKSWLIRITLNRVYEFYEKLREKEKSELDKDFLFNVISLTENEIHEIEEKKLKFLNQKLLLKILKTIPVDLRLPLMFQTVLKFNYNLCAEYIDIPEGTIASRIFRARKWIFNELAGESIRFNPQVKINYQEMKFLASEADKENLGPTKLAADNYPSELQIQILIRKLLESNLKDTSVPKLLKSKFSRKVRKLIKKKKL